MTVGSAEATVTSDKRMEIRRLKRIFGTTYFVQGTTGFINIPVLYFIKYTLGMGDAGGQLFQSLQSIGWVVKPLWGFISDRFPIFGYHRKSWFVLMAFSALVFWALNALLAALGVVTPLIFLLAFNLAFATYAFVDVVGDAIMVESGRRLKRIGSFVTFQWTLLAISNAIVTALGGWFQELIQSGDIAVWMIFLGTGIFPLATTIVGWTNITEERKRSRETRTFSKSISDVGLVVCSALFWLSVPRSIYTIVKKCVLFLLRAPRLVHAFVRDHKIMWYLALFFFFWNLNPSVGFVEFSYLDDTRDFSPSSFGIIRAAGGAAFFLSIICYGRFVKWFRGIGWHHYLYAMVALGVLTMPLSFFLYLDPEHPWWSAVMWAELPDWLNPLPGWNRYEWFRLIVQTTVLGFISIPAFLIPLKLAGEAVNLAYAGMGYAFLMSLANATGMLDGLWGGWMYAWLSADWMGWFVDGFAATPLNLAGVADMRTNILEFFVYMSAFFTLVGALFVWLLKREFACHNVSVNLAK